MAWTRGPLLPLRRVALRGREPLLLGCLVIRHHRGLVDSPFEGGTPTSPFSSAPQHMYETRRPTTTQGVTALRPQSSMRRLPAKRAKTSGPDESSRASQLEPPIATHARAPVDSELPSDMSPGSIIRCPMLTTPPIEGNLDCKSRPFHLESYCDQEAFRQKPKLRDSYGLLQR